MVLKFYASIVMVVLGATGAPLLGAQDASSDLHDRVDREFCSNLARTISEQIPVQMEEFEIQNAGKRAAYRVTDNLMIGSLRNYMSIGDLVGIESARHFSNRSINISAAIASALGARAEALLIMSVDELRQLPLTMERRDLVLIASDASVLDQKRTQLLVNTALRKRIRIFTLWTSTARLNDEASGRHWVSSLSLASGGRFVDLSAGSAVCH